MLKWGRRKLSESPSLTGVAVCLKVVARCVLLGLVGEWWMEFYVLGMTDAALEPV